MKKVIDKIKNWLIKILKMEKVQLLETSKVEKIENEKSALEIQFRNDLRTEPSDEEKALIKKFKKGQIGFDDLTEEIRNKIINGYTLMIDKNINIMENNMRKIESAK